jgi:hypothetical protein
MRRFIHLIGLCGYFACTTLAYAQDEMEPESEAAPAQAAPASPKPAGEAPAGNAGDQDQAPAAPPGTMEETGLAVLQALDKITARVSTIEVKTGETTTFGSLSLVVKACRKAPPEDTPESAAFIQVWEQKPGEDSHWVYSGWMFASSPSLAAMDHPVYDIWLLDCKKASTSSSSPAPGLLPGPAH